MTNIITYLQNQQKTFSELALNDVDSLVLSCLSYFNYDTLSFADCSGTAKVKLHDILALSDREKMLEGNWLQDTPESADFWMALMASRRYRDVEVGFFTRETSEVIEKQFSAISLYLPCEVIYLSFRGTDGSFAGWKEDFNMCFKKTVPSQTSAARYLSGIASATKEKLILGGHSKGGNLAEYATLVAEDQVYDRTIAVYNHDGPSFLEAPSPRITSDSYKEKLHKTVPESSAFGMIMEQRDEYKVVKSTASFVFQHQPFSWVVEGDDFLYQDVLNKSAVFFDSAINDWLKKHTSEERARVIDTIYDLFSSVDAENWPEYSKATLSNTRKIIAESTKLDGETRKFLLDIVSSLAGIIRAKTMDELLPDPPSFKRKSKD